MSNIKMIAHLEEKIMEVAVNSKGSNRQSVFYQRKGHLAHKTIFEMATRGIPGKVVGMNKIEKMDSITDRLEALTRLGAMVSIFRFNNVSDANGKPVTAVEQVTDGMVEEFMATQEYRLSTKN